MQTRHIFNRCIQFLRSRLSHFRSDADIEDEIESNLELEVEERRERGLSEQEARRRARLDLGDVRLTIEKIRDREFITALESWYCDIALGLREVRRNPVFSVTAILTLSLGIGANVAIFSFLYGLVLRPLPTRAPGELVKVGIGSAASNDTDGRATYLPFRMLRALQESLTSFGEFSTWDRRSVVMKESGGVLRKYDAALVSGAAFEVVSMRPHLGRLLARYDDVRGGAANGWPIVLSYDFWTGRLGSDPAVIGKRLRISGAEGTVVGVAPPDFRGVWRGYQVEMYLPLSFSTVLFGEDMLDKPGSFYGGNILTRLKPGVSLAAANAEVAHWQQAHLREFIPPKRQHDDYFRHAQMRVSSARTGFPSYVTRTYAGSLYLMQALVGVVLLLCCVNVSGLMMTKVYGRQREFAVRTALGARVWRLVRQHLTESLLIAVAGSVLGAAFAWRGCDLLLHFFRDPMMGEAMAVHPDGTLLYAAGALAVAVTLLFGAIPAWRAGHADPGELLKSRTTLGGKRRVLGRLFVPVQVALSLVLVTLASLLSQSVLKLRSERTGFDVDNITIQNAPLYLLNLKSAELIDLYSRMVDRLDEMPGVHSATAAVQTPLTGVEIVSRFQAVVSGSHPPTDSHMAFNDVMPGYFHAMGTRIVQGREFEKNERSLDVCVLNRSAAAFFFLHENAVGRYVRTFDDREFGVETTCRVVGIAEDAKFSNVRKPPPRTIYFPITKERMDRMDYMVFLINARSKQAAVTGFRKALSELAPTVPLSLFATLREQMDAALGSQELITLLSNFFGLLALLLSALGLYGLLAAAVAQRTAEIALRLALGAERKTVLWMVLREALGMLATGLLLGGAALFFATRSIAAMLHGISAFDPVTLAGTLAVLTLVTVAAALTPALRASSVDPSVALRAGD